MVSTLVSQFIEKPIFNIETCFLDELTNITGLENISYDKATKVHFSRSSLPKTTTPKVVIYPTTVEEIARILKVCSIWSQKVHVISTGNNWGYSDACAPSNESVIIHLKNMNQILDYNDQFGYIVVQPGVTQGQVRDFLKNKNSQWATDVTGAGPNTSLIGNISERGFGHGSMGDRFSNSLNYEVVLANGEIIKTGFGEFENSASQDLNKFGLGPSIDGLFSQSNLGIITKMTIWLEPKAEVFKGIFFALENDDDIYEAIEILRPLKLDGTIQTNVHIGNDLRVLAMNHCSPTINQKFCAALTEEQRKKLQQLNAIGAWNASMGVSGDKNQVNANIKKIKSKLKKIKGLKKIVVLDEKQINTLTKVCEKLSYFDFFKKNVRLLKKAKQGFELLTGTPPENSIQGCLWRTVGAPTELTSNDPLNYNAGFIWASPILPMGAYHLNKFNDLAKAIFAKYNFDFLDTLTMINKRSLSSVLTICYNKKDRKECEAAQKCHDELIAMMLENGYPPYRAGNLSFRKINERNTAQQTFLKEIKKIVDPENILSPGKYI
jgi:4-cresol dehydrogenase (hydroxylating)